MPATKFVEGFFDNRAVPSMQFAYVDVEIVSSIVNSLDIHKGVGTDGFSPWFLNASPYMVRLNTILINKCIASSSVLGQWKEAVVTPVPKCKQYSY